MTTAWDKIKRTTKLGFDALIQFGRSRKIDVSSRTEDRRLTQYDRLSLKSQSADFGYNMPLAGFMIRKHIQYMSKFLFSVETDDQRLNKRIEEEFEAWASDPNRCCSSRRHDFWSMLRIIEQLRVCDGDVGIIFLNNGALQIVESDRIHTETTSNRPDIIHGVEIGKWDQTIGYHVWRRTPFSTGYEYDRFVKAENMDLVGYFDRFDQVRGITPLAPSIRMFAHISDGLDYALTKMILEQQFGLVTRSDSESRPLGTIEEQGQAAIERFGKGPFHLDLGLDESIEFLKGETPSQNFQSFIETTIRMAFASLDIPYSFLDGSQTNFYGSRGDLNHYINGCQTRQRGLIVFLNRLARRLIERWIVEGRIALPPDVRLEEIRFKWIGAGIPYWRLIDDSKGYQIAVMNGFTNPEQVCAEHRGDFYDNVDRTAACIAYAKSKGVALPYDPDSAIQTNLGV